MVRWRPLTATTLTERVYRALRDRILAEKLPAGKFIREQEVSKGLGVSRTPVREALGRLASEGFLEHLPHRGFRVPKQSIADLADLYPIICTLEVLAGRFSFPAIDAEDLVRLRSVNEEYEKAMLEKDIRSGIELNDQFHHCLSEKAGNRRLCELLDTLRAEVRRLEIWSFSYFEEWGESLDEHEQILRAIEAKDFERGLAILEKNRLTTFKAFVERVSSEKQTGVEAKLK